MTTNTEDEQQPPKRSPIHEALSARRQRQADVARRLFGPAAGEPIDDEPEPQDAA